MMYKTVIERAFVLLMVLKLPSCLTDTSIDESYKNEERATINLEWSDTRRFCGNYGIAILQELCGPLVLFKNDGEAYLNCCVRPCTIRKLKEFYCISKFDPRKQIHINTIIVFKFPTTTEKSSPFAAFMRSIYDSLDTGNQYPRLTLIRIN